MGSRISLNETPPFYYQGVESNLLLLMLSTDVVQLFSKLVLYSVLNFLLLSDLSYPSDQLHLIIC